MAKKDGVDGRSGTVVDLVTTFHPIVGLSFHLGFYNGRYQRNESIVVVFITFFKEGEVVAVYVLP